MSKAQIAGELLESGLAKIASAFSEDARIAMLSDAGRITPGRQLTAASHTTMNAGSEAGNLGTFGAGWRSTDGSLLKADGTIEIPALHTSQPAQLTDTLVLKPDSALARLYTSMTDSVVKLEGVTNDQGKLVATAGSAVKLDYPGRFATAVHVTEGRSDLTVVDRFGNVHEAAPMPSDGNTDLGLVQLRDRDAFLRFKPVSLGDSNVVGDIPEEIYAAITHPRGWNRLYLSHGPVSDPAFMLVDPPSIKYRMHIEEGSSGGPVFNLDGGLVSIVSNRSLFPQSIHRTLNGGTSNYLKRLLNTIPPEADQSLLNIQPRHTVPTRDYQIGDRESAANVLQKVLRTDSLSSPPANYYHSNWSREAIGPELDVTYRVSHNVGNKQIEARVVEVNGARPDSNAVWPNTNTRMLDSRLTVQLDDAARPLSVHVAEDPLFIMPNALKVDRSATYLSDLAATTLTRTA